MTHTLYADVSDFNLRRARGNPLFKVTRKSLHVKGPELVGDAVQHLQGVAR